MATRTQINVYMYLLRLSNKYIKAAIKNYDKRRHAGKPIGHERHYKIDYHMFAFTQLIYNIKERLKIEYPSDCRDIESFFNNSTGLNAAAKQVANDLKHAGKGFVQVANVKISLDKKNNSSRIIESKTDRYFSSNDLRVKNKNLSKLFLDTYSELEIFLDSKNYSF